MADDAFARLRAAKDKADDGELAREQYRAYVADRVEHGGWSAADVAEYRAEVGRIMESGSDDEKLAARQFWVSKIAEFGNSARGVTQRIRESISAASLIAA